MEVKGCDGEGDLGGERVDGGSIRSAELALGAVAVDEVDGGDGAVAGGHDAGVRVERDARVLVHIRQVRGWLVLCVGHLQAGFGFA